MSSLYGFRIGVRCGQDKFLNYENVENALANMALVNMATLHGIQPDGSVRRVKQPPIVNMGHRIE